MKRLLVTLNDIWPQVAKAGIDVVLDFGFWRRALRDDIRQRAHSIGAVTKKRVESAGECRRAEAGELWLP